MPNLRPKRESKSRTSTPLPATAKESPSSATEPIRKQQKSQSLLDNWVEPQVKAPVPSFEEYGLARHGVLEHMNPLGVPPSAKLRAKLRLTGDAATKRSSLGRNGNVLTGEEAVSTPETTPARELAREESDRPDDDALQTMNTTQDEDEDDEYVPVRAKSSSRAARTPAKNGIAKITTPIRDSVLPTTPATDPNILVAKQRLHIAVNEAIRRANDDKRPNIGHAIKQMHEASAGDSFIAECLQNIMHEKCTPEQHQYFRHYMKRAKKELKKAQRVAARRESSMQSQTREMGAKPENLFTPINPRSTIGTIEKTTELAYPDENSNPPAAAKHRPRSSPPQSHSASKPLASAPKLSTHLSPAKRTEMPVRSPRKRKAPEDDRGDAITVQPHSTASKQPAEDVSPIDATDSDLSDVNEEIVQNGPPEPIAGSSDGSEPPRKPKGKRGIKKTNLGRKAAQVRANWIKSLPDVVPQIQTSEETRILAAKRDAMLKNFDDHPYQISRIRFDGDGSSPFPDTDSMRSELTGQAPSGLQNDGDRPRRNARAARNGTQGGPTGLRAGDTDSPQLDSAATSRPTTPVLPPPSKRVKLNNGQAARTKKSPVKTRGGPVAGIPHMGGGSRSLGPDGHDPASPQSDNNDFCTACNGRGDLLLLCCDGCPRSFHFACCDPPLAEDQVPSEAFYCHTCRPRLGNEDYAGPESFTAFGPLFKTLASMPVKSFVLPDEIQEYYDSVTVAKDGAYVESTKKIPLSKSSGYGAVRPDYLKTVNQNKAILCVQCGESSRGQRQMLQCDYCQEFWHIDCCDPPLANPPYISPEATHREAWRCPRHIEHVLKSGQVLQQDLNPHSGDTDTEDSVPVPRKVRKPKNPVVVEPAFSRGIRNNGLIEIANDPDYETDGEGNYLFSRLEREELDESIDQNGKIFRVPEKGIILDFVDKVKHSRIEKEKARKAQERAARLAEKKKAASLAHFAEHSIKTQQAALHLTQFAHKEEEVGLTDHSIEALVLGLTAEAPPAVVDAVSAAPPQPLSKEKRNQLLQLRDLIDRVLADHQ